MNTPYPRAAVRSEKLAMVAGFTDRGGEPRFIAREGTEFFAKNERPAFVRFAENSPWYALAPEVMTFEGAGDFAPDAVVPDAALPIIYMAEYCTVREGFLLREGTQLPPKRYSMAWVKLEEDQMWHQIVPGRSWMTLDADWILFGPGVTTPLSFQELESSRDDVVARLRVQTNGIPDDQGLHVSVVNFLSTASFDDLLSHRETCLRLLDALDSTLRLRLFTTSIVAENYGEEAGSVWLFWADVLKEWHTAARGK